jgi:hypothetical protein
MTAKDLDLTAFLQVRKTLVILSEAKDNNVNATQP